MSYTNNPYWWADPRISLDRCAAAPSELPASTEVAIIGSGYTGMAAALTLARAGTQVVLLDGQHPGWGCSGRNGGMIGPSFHKLSLKALKKRYGEDTMLALLGEGIKSLDYLIAFIEEEKIECELKLTGRFQGVSHPRHLSSLTEQTQSLSRLLNYPITLVSRQDQHQEIGSERYHGGAIYHRDGALQPAMLAQGMCARVLAAGAQIIAPAMVSEIRREGGKFILRVGSQSICSEQVIVASNGYSGKPLQAFRQRLIPIRSSIVATEELGSDTIRSLSPKLRSHSDTGRMIHYYRPSPDGRRMLFGARAIGQGDHPAEYVPYLRSYITDIYPQLAGVGLTHAWSGVVAYTFDHIPHIGVMNGIHYAMGYCGSGVGRSVYFGNKIALKLLGNPQGETVFDSLPFSSRPLYRGNPWFLPMILRCYGIADRFGF